MIITCKPHGVNLIGASVFINKPQKVLNVCQTLLLCVWGRDYIKRESLRGSSLSAMPPGQPSACASWSAVILVSSSPSVITSTLLSSWAPSHQQISLCKSTMDTNTEGCLSWKSLHNPPPPPPPPPTPYSGSAEECLYIVTCGYHVCLYVCADIDNLWYVGLT